MTDDSQTEPPTAPGRIAFLGPEGTFTEQAMLSQPDYAALDIVPLGTIADVLYAVDGGDVDMGFVPIENSIEGSVNATLDTLVFDTSLLMQREVVISVQLNLLVQPGTSLADLRRVASMPVAAAQCRGYLRTSLPGVEVVGASSTAQAAEQVAASDGTLAAIGTSLAAKLNGLEILATDIEDHPENRTRFVSVARNGVPAPTGHDKTSIVVFQKANRPGSLLAILQEFAARAIDLTRIESRPTKQSLGDYCFLIDFEGHVSEELVADCLRDLKSKHEDVQFLGSYPAASAVGPRARRDADVAWRQANEWVEELRRSVS